MNPFCRSGCSASCVCTRILPLRPQVHDVCIAQGAKILASRGKPAVQLSTGWLGRQKFNEPEMEALYWTYVWNEIIPGAAIMSYVGMFVDVLFIMLELQMMEDANFTARLASRLAALVVFGAIGLVSCQRRACSSNGSPWLLTALEVLASALLVVRNQYEPDIDTFWRNAGIWSIGLKSGLACFEVGYIRMLMFLASETTFQSVAHFLRPAWKEYPARWFLCVLVWFASHSYYVEHKSRQNFVQKCEFRLAHALAEEAHRLHRLLTDHTLEMICVHEFGDAAEKSGAIVARIKYVSNSCLQLTGWSASELVNKSPLDFVHVDDAAACRRFFHSWSQSVDGEDLVATSFLQASAAANGVTALPRSETANVPATHDNDTVLSLGFDDLSKLERDPLTIELVPLVSKESLTDISLVNAGIVHRTNVGPRTAKVQPIPLGASSLKMADKEPHSDSPHRLPPVSLTRWKPASSEDHFASRTTGTLSSRAHDQQSSSDDISVRSFAARNEQVLHVPDTVTLDDINPHSAPVEPNVASSAHVVPGTSSARFAYGGINLRFRQKSGDFITLDVTKSSTPEGIVCVYRDASWKNSPRLAIS